MGYDLGGSFALGPWRVHRAGYGAMQLAGDGVFGPARDRDEALRVLRAAVEAGVDHVDTAQFYGAGTVNELIREALHPYPDGLAIVSKVASRPGSAGASPRYGEQDHLRQGIEDNLVTLGVSRLAAVNLRMIDPSEPPGPRFDAELAALVKAREEGLIPQPPARQSRTCRAGGTAAGDAGPDRARLAARSRTERPADPGNPDARPSGREPRSSRCGA
jgi:aryl-alcohol dehydrogenase-like predicted oxidoreductase